MLPKGQSFGVGAHQFRIVESLRRPLVAFATRLETEQHQRATVSIEPIDRFDGLSAQVNVVAVAVCFLLPVVGGRSVGRSVGLVNVDGFSGAYKWALGS